jgi:hypothetical protein
MKAMNHTRLTKALTKAGATITNEGRRWTATRGNNVLKWWTQAAFDRKTGKDHPTELYATAVKTPHPDTDAQTDLFMDTFHDTIKSAVASLDWH